jgi:heterodisulfide reductase subunit A-like polyferredoxin/coenzyme F420-reducing hydrogenase delta subunit
MNDRDMKDEKSMKQVVIIGGGVAGLSAARVLENYGAFVHLVEKEKRLGGKAFEWPCMATDECQNCGACLSGELVDEVEHLRNVQIYLDTEISEITRDDKKLQITLTGSRPESIKADAILLATGFEPFDPAGAASLKYAKDDRVITTRDLNRIIKNEGLSDLFNRLEAPCIAFVQCVGSRNREQGRDYCSQVCCKTAIRQANKILDQYPNANISIFYMDLQIIGKEFRTQFSRLQDRVKLIQGVPGEILTDYDPERLTVVQEDEQSGKRMAHHFDLVILSVGMVSPPGSQELFGLLGIKTDSWGFLNEEVGSFVSGIYSAGAAKEPMDILSSKQSGILAAHSMAQDLGLLPDSGAWPSIAILGNGAEGVKIAQAMVSRGYEVKFLDSGSREMEKRGKLEYLSHCEILKVTGTPGNFEIILNSNNQTRSIRADTLVVATGVHHKTKRIEGLENESQRMMGLAQFEHELSRSHEKMPRRIAFLLDHLVEEWKDNARRVILLASNLAEQGREVFIIMNKMLVNGLKGQQIYDNARKQGVKFLRISKNSPPSFSQNEKSIQVTLNETTLGPVPIKMSCDLLVVPELIQAPDYNSILGSVLKSDLDREGFLQSANCCHRLISSPRKGLFFLGSCHDETDEGDMDREMSELISLLNQACQKNAEAAQINENHCIRCLTCFRICPHGAVELRNSLQPRIVPNACFGCGQCVSVCPAHAIQQESASREILSDESASRKTVVFACERSAALAEKEARRLGLGTMEDVQVRPVACAGSVGIETMLEPLLGDAERVVVLGCHRGNCRSGEGGILASRQIKSIATNIGLSERTLEYGCVAANEPAKFVRIVSA